MTIRSVNPYTSYQILLDLRRTKTSLATLSEQIASGNRLTSLADDPTASALILNLQDSIQKNSSYADQVQSASASLGVTETALQSVNDNITRLMELAQSGLTSASDSASAVEEINSIKENLLSLANTKENGRYIFAGTSTTTQPFTATSTGASYAGNHQTIMLDISDSTDIQTNIAGDTVFFNGDATATATTTSGIGSGGDLFAQVTNLATAMSSGDTSGAQTAYDNLENILGNVNDRLAELGGRGSALAQHATDLDSYNTTLENIQSNAQSVDYAAASAEYAQGQLSEQASYAVLSKFASQTLFNYLA